MTENANWKEVGDVYKTTGHVLEPGEFVTRDGHRIKLTPEDVTYLHNKITSHLPFVIDHEKYSETIGYAVKFAKDGDIVDHCGIVFDHDQFRDKVVLGGYNHISPEIDFVYDAAGNVVDKRIVKLAFVKNPAIKGNKTEVTRFAFSAPEVNSMTDSDGTNNINTAGTSPGVTNAASAQNVDYAAIVEAITTGLSTKIDSKFSEMQNEINNLKTQVSPPKATPAQEFLQGVKGTDGVDTTSIPSVNTMPQTPTQTPVVELDPVTKDVFDEYARMQEELKARDSELSKYREQNERVMKKQYSDVLAELRNLGYQSPDKLAASLKTYEEKIELLTNIKANHVKTAPMNSSNNTPMNSEGGSHNDKPTISNIVGGLKLKLSPEMEEHMAKKFGVPPR